MEYLRHRQIASAVDISHALHLTAADIRHHLAILAMEGIVEITGQRSSVGRGRPSEERHEARQADRCGHAIVLVTRRICHARAERARRRLF